MSTLIIHLFVIYCHVFSNYRRISDWWLNLLDTNTTHDDTSQITITHTPVFWVTLFGNGFQRRMFPSFHTHVLADWPPSQASFVSSMQTADSHPHLPSDWTPGRPKVPLYALSTERIENLTDRTENIVSNDSFIVACVSVAAETMCLSSRYLATDWCCNYTIIALTKSVKIPYYNAIYS
jgi:hypothetical protein